MGFIILQYPFIWLIFWPEMNLSQLMQQGKPQLLLLLLLLLKVKMINSFLYS